MKKNTHSKAFTLVEIMVVVVIIGLLAAIAIPAYKKSRTTTQMTTIENNVRQIVQAANIYFLENGVNDTLVTNLPDIIDDDYLKFFLPVAGEVYDLTIESGVAYVVTNTPTGVDYSVIP